MSSSSNSSIEINSTSSNSSNSSNSSMLIYSTSSNSSNSSDSSIEINSTSSNSSNSSIEIYSTSSNSSIEINSTSSETSNPWNFVKPLIFGHSATDNIYSIKNRIAQTITVKDTTLAIKKAYCYLYKAIHDKNLAPFDIYLGIYKCTNNGSPYSIISEISISSSIIIEDGWYEFIFDTELFSIDNKYISFVLRQSGGDENNYALWGYTTIIDNNSSISFISNDSINWEYINNTCFGLKVISGTHTLFDLNEGIVTTEGAEPIELPYTFVDLQNTANSIIEYDGTHLINNPDNPDEKIVEIKDKKLFISFVIDKSGSMGWMDRFNNRELFTNTFIDSISNNYSSEILYDMIGFGASQIDQGNLTQEGEAARINLDINTPSRTTFTFTAKDNSNAYSNAIYKNNDSSYIVLNNTIGSTLIVCSSNSAPEPSGVLIKLSGDGDDLIEYENSVIVILNNCQIASCGFKNFYSNKIYNIGPVQINNIDIISPTSKYWKMFNPVWETYPTGEYPTMEIGNNCPKNNYSIDVNIPLVNEEFPYKEKSEIIIRGSLYSYKENDIVIPSNISNSISIYDTTVMVSNSSPFYINESIDIIDGENISYNHIINNVYGQSLYFTPPSRYNIYDSNSFGGIVQKSVSSSPPFISSGSTISLSVKDSTVSTIYPLYQSITFFFQTVEGYLIEWDFIPQKEWKSPLMYWLGDSAEFNFNLIATNGKSLPDGTEIRLIVNGNIEISNSSNSSSMNNETSISPNTIALTRNANIGDTIIYINGVNTLEKYKNILIADSTGGQLNRIDSVGINQNGEYYIQLIDPLRYVFSIDKGAKIFLSLNRSASDESIIYSKDANKVTSLPLPFVDITPIYAGKKLDESYLIPSDPPQVEVTSTYEELNYDKDRIRYLTYNGPINDGAVAIRILPITEDVLKTDNDKKTNPELISELSPPNLLPDQLPLNENDYVQQYTSELNTFIGDDYSIETPIFLEKGLAKSRMTSFAINFSINRIEGLRLPLANSKNKENTIHGLGIKSARTNDEIYGDSYGEASNEIFSKKYTVSPYVRLTFKNNFDSFVQNLEPFDVYFAPRYNIYSNRDLGKDQRIMGSILPAVIPDPREPNTLIIEPPKIISPPGIYSTSSNTYSMTFTITDKFILLNKGKLTVNLYANPMMSCEDLNPLILDTFSDTPNPITIESLSVIYGSSINLKNKNSNLDKWRDSVKNNSLNVLLEKLLNSIDDINNTSINAPNISSSSSKILDTANWAPIKTVGLEINNGIALLTIDSLDYPALIMTEALYDYGDGRLEAVNKNYFFMGNPLFFRFFNTYAFIPNIGSTYDIGGRVMWMGNAYGTIQDGTIINIESSTRTIPSESKTIDGRADGLIIGPLTPWAFTNYGNELNPYPPGIPTMAGD